jgi:di/tricarboxylate transporter
MSPDTKMTCIVFLMAAILVSGGFFAGASGKNITKPNSMISILYKGILLLVSSSIILSKGLIKNVSAPGLFNNS